MSVEKPKWYRFDATYRRFKYFRFLNNFANPNWVFSPANFSVPPKPFTGEHGYNTRCRLGDFDLTFCQRTRIFRFNIGLLAGTFQWTRVHQLPLRRKRVQFPLGISGRAPTISASAPTVSLAAIDFSFLQGFRRFRDDSFIDLGPTPGINLNPAAAQSDQFQPQRTGARQRQLHSLQRPHSVAQKTRHHWSHHLQQCHSSYVFTKASPAGT